MDQKMADEADAEFRSDKLFLKGDRYEAKFLDGTPVPDSYRRQLNSLIQDACDVEDILSPDEIQDLERRRR